jgi:hypothetical protein
MKLVSKTKTIRVSRAILSGCRAKPAKAACVQSIVVVEGAPPKPAVACPPTASPRAGAASPWLGQGPRPAAARGGLGQEEAPATLARGSLGQEPGPAAARDGLGQG